MTSWNHKLSRTGWNYKVPNWVRLNCLTQVGMSTSPTVWGFCLRQIKALEFKPVQGYVRLCIYAQRGNHIHIGGKQTTFYYLLISKHNLINNYISFHNVLWRVRQLWKVIEVPQHLTHILFAIKIFGRCTLLSPVTLLYSWTFAQSPYTCTVK